MIEDDNEKSFTHQLLDRATSAVGDLNTAVQAAAAVGAAAATDGRIEAAVGLAAVFIGSRLASFASRRSEMLDRLVQDATEDIAGLEERVNRDFVRSDEFFGLAIKSKFAAINTTREEKLHYIRNFLVNTATLPSNEAQPDTERFLRLLDTLTWRELELFVKYCRIASKGDLVGLLRGAETGQNPISVVFADERDDLIATGDDPEEAHRVQLRFAYVVGDIIVAFHELEARRLLLDDKRPDRGYIITVLGRQFLHFILEPGETSEIPWFT